MVTPAPAILDQSNINYVKKLIQANPASDKLQNVITKYKDLYPKDFDGVNPIPTNQLKPTDQVKRHQFLRAARSENVADSLTTGKVIIPPNPCSDTTLDQMEAQLNNLFDRITGPGNAVLNMANEIKSASEIMSRTMTGFVNKMTGSLNDKLQTTISAGMSKLSSQIFSQVSKAFPYSAALAKVTKIQESLAPAIGSLLDGVFCVGAKITEGLSGMIGDLISAAVKNVTNVPACAVQQLVGAINNKIVNTIDAITGPLLGPITSVLGFSFNAKSFLNGGIDVLKRVKSFSSCGDKQNCPSSSKYVIGKGVKKGTSKLDNMSNFEKMFSGTALTQAATNLSTDFEKEYGAWNIFGSPVAESSDANPCNTGNPTQCGGPTMSIFGGGGFGGAGKTILGKFIDRLDTEDIFGAVKKTASIVGVEITNPGGGYTSDPIVSFDDECNQGYGAYGKAHVDKNPKSPTYGQITSITILTSGENYPAEDDESPLFVSKVIIEDPGSGYEETDTLDNFDLQIVDGRIIGGTLKNQIVYDDLPKLNINSDTGVGAILKPIMSKTRPQGEVVQVVDCIGS